MKKRIVRMLGLVAVGCILVSCATVSVESWTEPASEGRKINKVAVIGIMKSEEVRRRYEAAFVGRLSEAGVFGLAGYTVLPQEQKLTQQELDAALNKFGVDSVIVTRVLGQHEEIYETPGMYPDYYGNLYGFYDWNLDYMGSPGYVETYVETQLESNLYDVKSGKLVWTGRSRITDKSSDEHNIAGEVAAIIEDLRKHGMIPPLSENGL
jgi:hypothetical protein